MRRNNGNVEPEVVRPATNNETGLFRFGPWISNLHQIIEKLKQWAMVASLEFLGGPGGLPPGKGLENIAPDTLVRLG